jgi:hypothetical protein
MWNVPVKLVANLETMVFCIDEKFLTACRDKRKFTQNFGWRMLRNETLRAKY